MRWSDMDALRHINNVAFLRYLEDARVDWLYHRSPLERNTEEGVMVVHHDIDYRRQLNYRHQPIPVELWVSRIGGASFTVSAEIADTDEAGKRTVYARAKSVLATVDLNEGHPKRVSAELRHYLEQFAE
ncbi:MAG TPA: thioesterase family protein [Nocardioidaceae bacterium]|nr:thioesterase family protein [Nocardioidaceae bacterium]